MAAKESIKGTIENVVYYNEETDYAVLEVSLTLGLYVTAVGTMPIPAEGECVVLNGKWGYHKEFGKQFVIESFEKTLPADVEGILQYLSSHVVKGVGPTTAKKIVDRFGSDTFDVIEHNPEWLVDIPGITMKKAAAISESFREHNGLRGVIMFCKDWAFPRRRRSIRSSAPVPSDSSPKIRIYSVKMSAVFRFPRQTSLQCR